MTLRHHQISIVMMMTMRLLLVEEVPIQMQVDPK